MVFQANANLQQGTTQTGKGPEKKPDAKPASAEQSALDQAAQNLKRSYPLVAFTSGDALQNSDALVKNIETLQKLDDACVSLKPILDIPQGGRDRKATLGSLRNVDIQARIDRVIEVEDRYAALSAKKDQTAEEKAAVAGFNKEYQAALKEYRSSLDASIERLDVAAKQNGNPYAAFSAAKERYEKLLDAAAPTTTDHTGQPPLDFKQLESAANAYLEAGVKLLAFKKVYVTRAQADVKKADDAFFAKFGF